MHSVLCNHVLGVYTMKLDAGYDYLATAAPRGGVLHWHQRERVHRRCLHPGCLALAFYIVAERGDEVRVPERAVRLRHHCRPRHDGLRVQPDHRQQPGHGRREVRQYPDALSDRSVTDGRAMMTSALPPSIGHNQGTGDVGYGKICGLCFPP